MNGLGMDINEIIKSAYSTVLETQQAATETVGIKCIWARATPVINSEDVILQEYTLTEVGLECPRTIRAIVSNTDYNPGEYTIDLFNLQFVQPLEINVTIQEWNNVFGNNTMPQKGDVLYIDIYHKLFEVQSSELLYTIAALPTYYKVILSKYNPTQSRRETEDFRDSVEDLTITQQELFGDLISEEVADNNVTVETGYNNTTYVDPQKDFDIDSIVVKQIFGSNNNLISNAYYNFINTDVNIVYHTDLIYDRTAARNHLIYSCWCRNEANIIKSGSIKALSFYSKDAYNWYFIIGTTFKLNVGDSITITRGTLLKVNATVVELYCQPGYGIAIKTSDMSKANKKLTKWYENPSVLKIYKMNQTNLLRGYDSDQKQILDITYKINEIVVQIDSKVKSIPVTVDMSDWNYFMLDISPSNIRVVIVGSKQVELNKFADNICTDTTINFETVDFNVDEFRIENAGADVQMCNIRLYENEYEAGDIYMPDMYSPVTKNASKLILVDSPNVPNKTMFVSPVK